MRTKRAGHFSSQRTLAIRLHRIKGQIEGVEKMVNANEDCSDILMQVVSARRALKSFSEEMIGSHLRERLGRIASRSENRRELRSLLEGLKRYID